MARLFRLGIGIVMVSAAVLGCGPHNTKHYRSRGQAQHFPNCRDKCPARTATDWHERRR